MRLRQYHDADLERRLTRRYSALMPDDAAEVRLEFTSEEDGKSREKSFFKIEVVPVELDPAPGLKGRILFGDREQRQAAGLLRTIARVAARRYKLMPDRCTAGVCE